MKFIVGRKIEMTQVWKGEEVEAVTKVQAGPCFVTQVKTSAKDGYDAVQVGFGRKKEKNIRKPQLGHLKAAKDKGIQDNFQFLREFKIDADNKEVLEVGDKIDVNAFAIGDVIAATGVSRGLGFQGVVKRHGFSGGRSSHGDKDQLRMPGSTGSTGAGHVFKGTKKPGRTGGDTVTIKNLEILEVDQQHNILSIKGGLPGSRNSLILIKGKGNLAIVKPEIKKEDEVTEKKESASAKATEDKSASAKATEDKSDSAKAAADKEVVAEVN